MNPPVEPSRTSNLRQVMFVIPGPGRVAGSRDGVGGSFRTVDGGKTWQEGDMQGTPAIVHDNLMLTQQDGWAVGINGYRALADNRRRSPLDRSGQA